MKNSTKKPRSIIPFVAIIGKPNVGKSSLFNRLVRRRIAITSNIPGTTRDRIYNHLELQNTDAILIDTGGMEYGKKQNIEKEMQLQAKLAIEEADLILFVVDSLSKITIDDLEATKILRKSTKPLILIANKCDNEKIGDSNTEYLELGFGEPHKISVIHNKGIDGLMNKINENLKNQGWQTKLQEIEQDKTQLKLAFIGRPNVGKSSLVNAILGEKKIIESNIAGTTRDSIDIEVIYNNQKFNLIDTAGIRRRGKIEQGIEKFSTFRSLEAIERSDISCLILDFKEGIRSQDLHIASYILDAGKGLILIVNKSDLMKNKNDDENRIIRILKSKFDFLPWAPVIFTSALKKTNLKIIFQIAQKIQNERTKIVDNAELEEFLKEVISKHQTPTIGILKILITAIRQASVKPPTFEIFVNYPEKLHFSYKRYIENKLREKFGFDGTAIRIFYKKFAGRKNSKKIKS